MDAIRKAAELQLKEAMEAQGDFNELTFKVESEDRIKAFLKLNGAEPCYWSSSIEKFLRD